MSESIDPASLAGKDVLGFEEAAAFFGVSTKTFQKVLREERLPGRKVGREWKFSRKALLDWLGKGSVRDYQDDDSSTETEEATEPNPAEIRPVVRRAAADRASGAPSADGAPRASSRVPPRTTWIQGAREGFSADED